HLRHAVVAWARRGQSDATEERSDQHRVLGVRDLTEVGDEAGERSVAEQVELDVRDVERRQLLAARRDRLADVDDRGRTAQIAGDRYHEILLLEPAHELERILRREKAAMAPGRVRVEQQIPVGGVVPLRRPSRRLELQRKAGVGETLMEARD